MTSADDGLPNGSPSPLGAAVVLDVLIVLALGWVLWVTVDAEAGQVVAALEEESSAARGCPRPVRPRPS